MALADNRVRISDAFRGCTAALGRRARSPQIQGRFAVLLLRCRVLTLGRVKVRVIIVV